ncbi:hypothetical protein CRE_08803 [Caenorhabditis remanei]|uniref:F-box domain-containing protein n=1 Tax=Caenorhabditis remanei TaxID=31234 RepID=E3LHM1_CAERE|nr:hypothetical protein CRE_08803 [Caenorhabditis remanei]
MTTGFPLLRLPYLVLMPVLEQMEFMERIALSILSKRTRMFLKLLKMKCMHINLIFKYDTIEMQVFFDTWKELKLEMFMGGYVELRYRNDVFLCNTLGLPPMDYVLWIMDVLHCKSIKEFKIERISQCDILPLLVNLPKVDEVVVSDNLSDVPVEKRLLKVLNIVTTSQSTALSTFVKKYQNELSKLKNATLPIPKQDIGQIVEVIDLLDSKIQTLEATTIKLSEQIEKIGDEEDANVKNYEEKLPLLIQLNQDAINLRDSYHAVLKRIRSENVEPVDNKQNIKEFSQRRPSMEMERQVSNLPPVKLPVFSGKRWEFQKFWSLYEEIIHKAEISNILKFTHLLNHLQGGAKELLDQFQITPENYDIAVKLLKNKYADTETTILELNEKVRKDCAKDSSTREQRLLFERLMVAIKQLERLQEPVDNRMMKELIMEKFNDKIRRATFKKKIASSEDWTISKMFTDIEENITLEEDLELLMKGKNEPKEKADNPKKDRNQSNKSDRSEKQKKTRLSLPLS